ncbi:hypothetical protein, partial [Nostoc sp.]|uniref:hypothetical protein n=1 Tax=Nostoc sp. TaxID=1180 RepID=UPI003004407E
AVGAQCLAPLRQMWFKYLNSAVSASLGRIGIRSIELGLLVWITCSLNVLKRTNGIKFSRKLKKVG